MRSHHFVGTSLILALLNFVEPTEGAAQDAIAFHLEVGAGSMLSDHQVRRLDYGSVNVEGTARVSLWLVDELVVQVSAGYWHFVSDTANDGFVVPITAGLRLQPRLGDVVRLWVDANGGVGLTGSLVRPALDAGLGLELALNSGFALGPFGRAGFVFEVDGQGAASEHAIFWAAGLTATIRPWAGPASDDPDGDGVVRRDDRCPTEPEDRDGFEDADGCPESDDDADGIPDADDSCPRVAETRNGLNDEDGCPDDDDPDRDGVRGESDRCPGDPEDQDSYRDEDGCPDADDDGDGIPDLTDGCPRAAETTNGFEDDDGCPDQLPDADHDLIPEPPDVCPTRPETWNGHEDADGCPDTGGVAVSPSAMGIQIPFQIRFAINSDRIVGVQSQQLLDSVASVLRQYGSVTSLELQGHTDDQGLLEHNDDLSRRRAEAVAEALVSRGVSRDRLVPHGYGERCPLRAERSRSARDANRRVEFIVLEPRPPLMPVCTWPPTAAP